MTRPDETAASLETLRPLFGALQPLPSAWAVATAERFKSMSEQDLEAELDALRMGEGL